jgi:hypothetical protein
VEGLSPYGTRDGRGIFYRGATRLVRATIGAASPMTVQLRDTVFVDDYRKEVKAVAVRSISRWPNPAHTEADGALFTPANPGAQLSGSPEAQRGSGTLGAGNASS